MTDAVLNTFNRGEVSRLAFAREEVERVKNSGELVENWLPLRLGPMVRRPGFEVLDEMLTGSRIFKFFYSFEEQGILEFGDTVLRIWLDEAKLARTSVTSTITNGTFSSGLTGWTDASGAGASTSGFSDKGVLVGADTTDAVIYQTLGSTQIGVEHGLRVVVEEAPVRLLIGTSGVRSSDITDSLLQPGTYSLAFTPDAAATITLINSNNYRTLVEEVTLEPAGIVELPTPVDLAGVERLQPSQSAGRIFFSRIGEQFIVERRGPRSWGVAEFRSDDGPFDVVNNDAGLTLTASNLSGNVTLTASKPHFMPNDVGSLRRLLSAGQLVSASVAAEDNGTDGVRITGVEDSRNFNFAISGSFVANIYLQRSVDEVGWEDVDGPFTAPVQRAFNDGLDNAIYFYRLHVKATDYTSGTAVLQIAYSGGGIEGIGRITAVISDTVVNAQVLEAFGSLTATRDWYPGQWGGSNGYPNACRLYEGRLWFAGKGGLWGSVSDAFRSFNRRLEGASRSIFKTIGFGPVDDVNWIAPAVRLALGISSDEVPVRSSSFGEVLTQDNSSLREGPAFGSSPVLPVTRRNSLFYVGLAERKIYQLDYVGGSDSHDATDLTLLNEAICAEGVAEIDIVGEPEIRVIARLKNGEARILLSDATEDIQGWSRLVPAAGTIERIVTLRGREEDLIYAKIAYGGTEYLCKMAPVGAAAEYPVDLYSEYAASGTVCDGLERFNGQTVQAWSGSTKVGDFVVSGGQITLPQAYSNRTVGLAHVARYRSAKLGVFAQRSVLAKRKRVVDLALLLSGVWHDTFTFGQEGLRQEKLPLVHRGKTLDVTQLIEEYDTVGVAFEGAYDVDTRIEITASGPATVLALSYDFDDSETAPRAA